MPAKVANDDAGQQERRGAWGIFRRQAGSYRGRCHEETDLRKFSVTLPVLSLFAASNASASNDRRACKEEVRKPGAQGAGTDGA